MFKKISYCTIIFCIILSLNAFAQENNNGSKVVRFNGIYQTSNLGKEFILKRDSTKTFKVDTSGFVGINRFKKVKNSFDVFGRPALSIELDDVGTVEFAILTENNVGEPLTIIINNVLYTAPIVNEKISNGLIELTGFNTIEELEKLKRLIAVVKLNQQKKID